MTNPRPPLTIDLISDVICPWCYVGFRGLDWVRLALSFNYELTVRYRPYRLDPDTPPEGRDRIATLARKFPDPAQRAATADALRKAMADVGLSFDLERPKLIPDTTDAHRIIRWAEEYDLAHAAKDALFEAYWQHGEDIGQHDVLVQAAAAAGLDPEEMDARLATPEDREAVRQEAAEYRGGGVSGVPTFIVNEQAGFSGAYDKATLLDAIRNLAQETAIDPDD